MTNDDTSKRVLPEKVQALMDPHDVVNLLAANDPVGAAHVITRHLGISKDRDDPMARSGQFALNIAEVAVDRILSPPPDRDPYPVKADRVPTARDMWNIVEDIQARLVWLLDQLHHREESGLVHEIEHLLDGALGDYANRLQERRWDSGNAPGLRTR